MARIDMIPQAAMDEAQRLAVAEVSAGKRGKVPAPMVAWLRNGEMARRTQSLGELLRYETSMSEDLVELAILICARHWTAHVQWKAHKVYALAAGLEAAIIADIAAHRSPDIRDPRQRMVYEICHSLLKTGRVNAGLYAEALAVLGEVSIAELMVLLGYYCVASFTLNTFEMGLPEAVVPELNDPDFS